MSRFIVQILGSLILGVALPILGMVEAQAQTPQGQQAPAHRQAAPSPGTAPGAQAPGRSNPAGTSLPSYAQPSRPSSSFGQSRGGTSASDGRMQTNNGPGVPSDPNQVPLGGAEWLAAAGAAYALNRLRDEESDEDSGEDA